MDKKERFLREQKHRKKLFKRQKKQKSNDKYNNQHRNDYLVSD